MQLCLVIGNMHLLSYGMKLVLRYELRGSGRVRIWILLPVFFMTSIHVQMRLCVSNCLMLQEAFIISVQLPFSPVSDAVLARDI